MIVNISNLISTASSDAARLEFAADYGALFGSSATQTQKSAFTSAVNASLASFGVKTSGISSINVFPGSVIADVQGSTASIAKVKELSTSADFYIVFNGVTYYLTSHQSATNTPSSKYCHSFNYRFKMSP